MILVSVVDSIEVIGEIFLKKMDESVSIDLCSNPKVYRGHYIFNSVDYLRDFSVEIGSFFFDQFNWLEEKNRHRVLFSEYLEDLFIKAMQKDLTFKDSCLYLYLIRDTIKYIPVKLDYKTKAGKNLVHQLADLIHFLASEHAARHVNSYKDLCTSNCVKKLNLCKEIFKILKHKRVIFEDGSKESLLNHLTSGDFIFDDQGDSAVDILLDINSEYLKKFFYKEKDRFGNPENFYLLDTLLSRYPDSAIETLYKKHLVILHNDGSVEPQRNMFLTKLIFFKNRLLSDYVSNGKKQYRLKKIYAVVKVFEEKCSKSSLLDRNLIYENLSFLGEKGFSNQFFLAIEKECVENPLPLKQMLFSRQAAGLIPAVILEEVLEADHQSHDSLRR